MLRLVPFAHLLSLSLAATALGVDLELFEFNDTDGTPLTAAANSANPGNQWFYDEEATTPGDATTGDISSVQGGVYQVVTESAFDTGLESRFLDIENVSSGQLYLAATLRSWNFGTHDGTNSEQFRFTLLDDDTGMSGATVTAQMQIRRNASTGNMELLGDAIGTAGSFDIARTVDLPDAQNDPFTMVLALDADADSFEVFYKDGSNPSQVLGLGAVSRVRNANSIRMVTNNFGAENFPPFILTEQVNVDRIVVSDTNPLADLITLEIDRVTGAMTLINTSGAEVQGVDGVSLESTTGSVDLTDFVDFSGSLAAGQSVPLDAMPAAAPGLWIKSPVEDIRAELALAGGGIRTLDVNFINNDGVKWIIGDLNFNGMIDVDDYAILATSAEADLSGLSVAQSYQVGDLNGDGANDVIDFGMFKDAFIAANGVLAFNQLLASVPEPSAAALALLALLALGLSRGERDQQRSGGGRFRTNLSVLASAVLITLAASVPPAEAVIFEDFVFDDPAGTLITGAANSANPGNMFDEDSDTIDVMTNGLGQLDASLKSNTSFGTNYVDVEPALTSGTIFGVMELSWDFQSPLDTSENEEIRISLTNNNPRGTEITAEFRIVRNDSDQLVINGMANGAGASDLPDTLINSGSLVQAETFIAVVAANLDSDSYEILYSNDAGVSFLSAGVGNLASDRVVEALRMTLNNDLAGDNVLIDRVYLADALPIVVEPDVLTLQVDPLSGNVSIVNDSATTFDIDHYRILSGDNSLIPANWNSLQDQAISAVDGPDSDSIAGNGIGETWTEAGGSHAAVLSESFLLSSTAIAGGAPPISLGRIFDVAGDEQLLTFEYRDATNGNVFSGDIVLAEGLAGDFNMDGVVDAADYTVWRDNLGGAFQAADYAVWKNNFGAAASMATSPAAPVPEPASAVVVLFVVAAPLALRARKVRASSI